MPNWTDKKYLEIEICVIYNFVNNVFILRLSAHTGGPRRVGYF